LNAVGFVAIRDQFIRFVATRSLDVELCASNKEREGAEFRI
jgi:hypothetical protein